MAFIEKIKEKAMRKSAEAKATLVSTDAATNSIETAALIVVSVVIVCGLGVVIKKVVGDESTGLLGGVGTKLKAWSDGISAPTA